MTAVFWALLWCLHLRSMPEVHAVSVEGNYVVVRSAGVSLKYLGPLQLAPVPSEAVRDWVFRIPREPVAETGRHARVPVDVIGAFVNGLPIYNHFEAVSWNGADLWHYDTVKYPAAPGLIEQMAASGARLAPIIGFALDGYPVYGPSGFRSSYRLRAITQRHVLPDGTELKDSALGYKDAG